MLSKVYVDALTQTIDNIDNNIKINCFILNNYIAGRLKPLSFLNKSRAYTSVIADM